MNTNFKVALSMVIITVGVIVSGNIFSQTSVIGFDSEKWDKTHAQVVEHLGRQSLKGIAFLPDIRLENGIIEVDIATTEKSRSYPGVLFRIQNSSTYERIYIRPHRSPYYDDALQYAPIFNGIDSWQLYNGPGKTAALDIDANQWNHLKIVVSGERAEVFWNKSESPDLVIDKLAHGKNPGSLGLNGAMDGSAFFSNFSFQIIDTLMLSSSVPDEPVYGAIKNWEISPPFPLLQADFAEYPGATLLSGITWKPVDADETGLVDISRYYPRQSHGGDCLLAKSTIIAETDTLLRVGFGYSDYITVFLNKKPMYFGNAAYRSRDKSFLGIVGYFDNLFLPLKKGPNEIVLMVGETMGGWAFSFRKENDVYVHESLQKQWTIKGPLAVPETVVYDPKNDVCYVSNYFNDGNEYISKISTEGKVLVREWIKDLQMPTGMCVWNYNLYAIDRSGLNVIDTREGKIVKKIPLKGTQMPNDVAVDAEGNLYITDTPSNMLFIYSNDSLETLLTGDVLNGPNGLFIDGGQLLIGMNEKVLVMNLKDKKVTTLVELERGSNVDGIQQDGKGNYLISDYNGKLYCITRKGEKSLLMNTSTPGQWIADFSFIPEKKLLVIPTFYENSVIGYSMK
jgi:DNA-binding beta-propeller fold protein YncE